MTYLPVQLWNEIVILLDYNTLYSLSQLSELSFVKRLFIDDIVFKVIKRSGNDNSNINSNVICSNSNRSGLLHTILSRHYYDELSVQIVKSALKRGYYVDTVDNSGWTLLEIVAFKTVRNSVKIAEILLSHGADPNHSVNGKSILRSMIYVYPYYNEREIMKLLLLYGADINECGNINGNDTINSNNNGESILISAVANKSVNFIKSLFLMVDHINKERLKGVSASGNNAIVRMDIDSTVNNSTVNNRYQITPIIIDIEHYDNYGYTALLHAIHHSYVYDDASYTEIIRLLLSHGADPNRGSRNEGNTPLMLACRRGEVSKIRLLLSAGADPNIQNRDGSTALLESILPKIQDNDRCYQIVQFLIEYGADPSIVNNYETDCLSLARRYRQDQIYELLKNY